MFWRTLRPAFPLGFPWAPVSGSAEIRGARRETLTGKRVGGRGFIRSNAGGNGRRFRLTEKENPLKINRNSPQMKCQALKRKNLRKYAEAL
jgi:hypothetical protein